jgi:hypothetical protein
MPVGPAAAPPALAPWLPTPSAPLPGQWAGLCLLSVGRSQPAGQPPVWHARLLLPDGQVLDFDSPFELVRYLSRLPSQPVHGAAPGDLQPGARAPGLR